MVILLPGGEAVVGKGLVDSAIAAMDHKIKELDRLTLNVYAHVMDRDEKENERLRALVNGESLGRLGTGAQRATPAAIPWFLLRATKPAPRAGSHLMGAAGFEPATSRV